ncbi:MAG: DMT family transporter [Firmicutes bacterium]|nr:DMT family transporter [Bacillota bacterium]
MNFPVMKRSALLAVNLAVFLFGLAGLFAKWIQMPAMAITFGRVMFSAAALGIWRGAGRQSFRVERGDLWLLGAGEALLAVHWWAFLEAIQRSTVAVGTITFSTFPLFVTFLEPLVFRQKIVRRNVLMAIGILAGVMITLPSFMVNKGMLVGFAIGMLSSLTYAILTVVNKKLAQKYNSSLAAFYEQATAAVLLLPVVIGVGFRPSGRDLLLLLVLGIVMTAVAHTLFISSLKELPAQLAGLCSSMETVYSILFAALLLDEIPTVREIIGALVIIAVVAVAECSAQRMNT